MAAAMASNGAPISLDWQDRYFHVDQILNKPGPRTDPSFSPGEPVSEWLASNGRVGRDVNNWYHR